MTEPSHLANIIAGSHHVYDSNLAVLRHGYEAMAPSARRDPAKRELRRDFYRQLIEAHRRNRELFEHFRF